MRNLDKKTVQRGLLAFLAVVAVVVGAIALLGDDSDDGAATSGGEPEAVALTAVELVEEASTFDHPVFWVGSRVGTDRYELSSDANENVYVRYLTGDAEAGSAEADFLTIGTYPLPDAKQALKQAAQEAAGVQQLSRLVGYEVLGSQNTTNAYVVFDDQPELQIEIYSPEKGEAEQLATSGALEQIGL